MRARPVAPRSGPSRAAAATRGELHARLEARREEIEAAALTRVRAIADPAEIADPAYAEGLRRTVPAAIGFGIEAIAAGEGHEPPIPVELLAQARLAARNRIPLDTVLRRYLAGYALLSDALIEVAEQGGAAELPALRQQWRSGARLFDRLIAAVVDAYIATSHERRSSIETQRARWVEELLIGRALDPPDLGYDLAGAHVAAIGAGPGAPGVLRELAAAQRCQLLLISREDGHVWAWLGGVERNELNGIVEEAKAASPQVVLAFGEPGMEVPGWRLTHRQAQAAMPVACRGTERIVRYADTALLAAALRDDLLAASLHAIFLDPLSVGRDGGGALKQTIRAYLAASHSASSAAAVLGVDRRTVANRLRLAEQSLGRTIHSCAAAIETALRLEEIEGRARARVSAGDP